MKIFPEQLPQYLAKEIAPVYLVSGNEPFLMQEACDLIRNAANKNEGCEREVFEIASGFAWERFFSAIKNLSLLGTKRLIELRLNNIKLNSDGLNILENCLSEPTTENILLIITPKLDAGWQKIKWLKMIEEKGIFLQIWPIEAKYFPTWIYRRLRQKGTIANNEVCQFLAEKLAGNLLAAAQEIEKLELLHSGSKIAIEQVITTVSDNARYNIFELVDHALQGEAKKVVAALYDLQAEGVEPILVLWAFARELRTLIAIMEKSQRGYTLEQAIQEKCLFNKHILVVKRALARLSIKHLENLLQKAAQIDLLLKGIETGNVWREMQQLALSLTFK